MNILFVSNDPSILTESSARNRMRQYAAEVEKTGGTLHILTRAKQRIDIADGPLQVYGRNMLKPLLPWSLSRQARELITAYGIDIVSAQDPFEHGLAALWAVRGTQAKLHIQVHTDYLTPWFTRGAIFRSPRVRMPLLNHIRRHIAHKVLPHADGIRTVSKRVKDSMCARYGNTIPEPSVISIPVATEVPPPVPLPETFPFTLIAIGRLEPEKRVQDCIAVVARLRDSYPALGLVIVGDGRERKRLERYAQKRGVADRVRFLGWRSDAWGLMQSAQAFIQASAYEGYGITLVEAALAGVPILTSDAGIVGEVFVGYEHVFAAPPGDPSNLAALAAQLIEDHQARSALVIAAKQATQAHLAQVRNTAADIIADIARAVAPKL